MRPCVPSCRKDAEWLLAEDFQAVVRRVEGICRVPMKMMFDDERQTAEPPYDPQKELPREGIALENEGPSVEALEELPDIEEVTRARRTRVALHPLSARDPCAIAPSGEGQEAWARLRRRVLIIFARELTSRWHRTMVLFFQGVVPRWRLRIGGEGARPRRSLQVSEAAVGVACRRCSPCAHKNSTRVSVPCALESVSTCAL